MTVTETHARAAALASVQSDVQEAANAASVAVAVGSDSGIDVVLAADDAV